MQETVLVQRARGGDLAAFNQLVADHQALAFDLAYRLLEDGSTAEVIVQQSILQAFQRLDEFQGEHFLYWLLRMVVNTCRDLPASAVSQARIPAGRIEHDLSLLPFEQRLAILLSDVHRFSRQDVAFIMNGSDEVVKAAIHNARSSLRRFLFGPSLASLGSGQPFAQAILYDEAA